MYQLNRLPISVFIKNFRISFNEDEIVKIFTRGYCYHFAMILKNIYNEGRIVYSQSMGHFALKYKNGYYDITGKIRMENPIDFDSLYYDDVSLRDCVLKINYYPPDNNEWCQKID